MPQQKRLIDIQHQVDKQKHNHVYRNNFHGPTAIAPFLL
jgi:hypothetical protein